MTTATADARKIAALLAETDLASEEQLRKAVADSDGSSMGIVTALVDAGVLDHDQAMQVLELHDGIPYVDLSQTFPDPDALSRIPEELARRHGLIPLDEREGKLTVAMADPMDVLAIDDVERAAGMPVRAVRAAPEQIEETIQKQHSRERGMESAAAELGDLAPILEEDQDSEEAEEELHEGAPVVNFVNGFVLRAIERRASDIHVEAGADESVVRCRIDGVLRDMAGFPSGAHRAVISRLKVLADMDIGERRKPQDGRFSLNVQGRSIDFRVSCLPTVRGEKVVLRILDKEKSRIPLEEIGLSDEQHLRVTEAICRPHGVFIVTGPTGSGKTTTLYSVLRELNTGETNIVTCEDPVEYRLQGINQVQLDVDAGLTFSGFLRSVLRQDPDIIMVGEMRDAETAELAVRAALTGHLVLATLHTNDAPGVASRLTDMEVEPYLIASTLVGALAQRLVRTICPHCRERYSASPEELRATFPELDVEEDMAVFRGRGCRACGDSGHMGRKGIFEMLSSTERIRRLISDGADSGALGAAAREEGMTTLREAALREVREGNTSLREAARITAREM